MKRHERMRLWVWANMAVFGVLTGCVPIQQKSGTAGRPWPPAPEVTSLASATKKTPRSTSNGQSTDAVIATVDGRPIPRAMIVEMLLKSHGAGLLEQMIALEAVAAEAVRLGISITDADIEREFVIGLRRLNPGESKSEKAFDRAAAEKALDAVLAERNISTDEFAITLRRNAFLRKIVETNMQIPESMIDLEYRRNFGERVRVRHIQLSSMAEVNRVLERIQQGENFGELASTFSTNATSARRGGMMAPFSLADDETPEAFRRAAFQLNPGQVSNPIHVGQWFHILRLEERIPAETPPIEDVRAQLEAAVLERLSEVRMREMYSQLVGRVQVMIEDPVLREAHEKRNRTAP